MKLKTFKDLFHRLWHFHSADAVLKELSLLPLFQVKRKRSHLQVYVLQRIKCHLRRMNLQTAVNMKCSTSLSTKRAQLTYPSESSSAKDGLDEIEAAVAGANMTKFVDAAAKTEEARQHSDRIQLFST